MNDLEKLFEKEVKEFGEAYGHEAAYAFDVAATKLLSSQEQKHRKEMEELIEEIPDFNDRNTDYGYDAQYLKQSLKSKYLTKGKE